MPRVLALIVSFFVAVTVSSFAAEQDFLWNTDNLTLVFPTPSEDSSGSVPIGNGENAANVWIEKKTGDLLLLLARTDSWDGFCRILKPGRIRISFGSESPFKEGAFQLQTLDLQNGLLRVRGRDNAELLVFVDAHRPMFVVQFSGDKSVSIQAGLEVWRTVKRDISDAEMDGIGGNQYGLVKDSFAFEEPDTILDTDLLEQEGFDSLCWYHRNTVSIWPVIMKQQGFRDVIDKFQDPLIHRTFGGLVFGRSGDIPFKKNGIQILESVEANNHEIFVILHTAQTETAEIWCNETTKITQNIIDDYKNFSDENSPVVVNHKKWWSDFWNRSHIRVLSSTTLPALATLPPCEVPLTIGTRPNAPAFVGEMAAPAVYSRALSADEIQKLSKGAEIEEGREYYWDFSTGQDAKPGPLDGKLSAKVFDASTSLQKPHDPNINLSHALTLACWVLTDGVNNGRLIDKCVPGSSEAGFVLDLDGGGRFLGKSFWLTLPQPIPAGQWTHFAATFDGKTPKLYVNGDEAAPFVGGWPIGGSTSDAPPHEAITRGYALQRYVLACAGRGNFPMKFNGNLFTVELKDGRFNPDYRVWGQCYFTQNTRLLYWPMLAAGDFDLLQAGMRLYTDQVPLAKERNRIFFNRGDSLFICEVGYFWGMPMMGAFGGFDWDKPGEAVFMNNDYIGRHWNGGLEMANMMFDYCAFREDQAYLKKTVVPFADAIIRFFDIISPKRDEYGRMVITEATAQETWWYPCFNPMPDVAGLHCIIDRLLALPRDYSTPQQREHWSALQKILPVIPIGEVAGSDGVKRRMLLPAMEYSIKGNIEVPELYAVFPYQIFGVGRGELEAGINAFEQRRDKHYRGWGQDEIFAAHLGLAEDAAKGLAKRFDTWADGFRFPAMWGPNFDWIPDQDHGCSGMIALQAMLLQSVGDKILLLPAWPRDWDVEFKLHAPRQTVIKAKYASGKLLELSVDPPERRKDIVFE